MMCTRPICVLNRDFGEPGRDLREQATRPFKAVVPWTVDQPRSTRTFSVGRDLVYRYLGQLLVPVYAPT